MAEWKKVLVSGSNIEVNQITGSGDADIQGTLSIGGIADVSASIAAAGSSLSTGSNAGIDITNSIIGTTYNTTIADNIQSVEVGGIDAGTTASSLKSKNIIQVLDDILFPTILPSIGTAKSVALTTTSGGTFEIGRSLTRTLTATFNDGQITNGDGTTGPNLVGSATQYTFTGTGITSTAQAGNTLSITWNVVSGDNDWDVTVAHGAGTGAYYDNKGNAETNLDSSRASGTVTDNNTNPNFTGLYPYFYYKSTSPITTAGMVTAIENGDATKVVASSTGTLSIPYNVSAEYIAVAYPQTSTTKTVYYVSALDSGAITAVFNAVSQNNSIDSPDSYWTGVNYKIHTSINALTNSASTIELRNS